MAVKPGALVAALDSALRHGGAGLKDVPDLVIKVIRDNAWQDFETLRGETRHYDSFPEFVNRELGVDIPLLRDGYCKGRPDAKDLIDQALQRPEGQPGHDPTLYNIQGTKAPTGTSTAAALRTLRTKDPDLHKQVIDKKLSPHGAMVKAGLRPKTMTVRPEDPEYTARALKRNMSPKDIETLKGLL